MPSAMDLAASPVEMLGAKGRSLHRGGVDCGRAAQPAALAKQPESYITWTGRR
jgi:hypothetical protein